MAVCPLSTAPAMHADLCSSEAPVFTTWAADSSSASSTPRPSRLSDDIACSTTVRLAPAGKVALFQAVIAACIAPQFSWPKTTISGALSEPTAYSTLASTPVSMTCPQVLTSIREPRLWPRTASLGESESAQRNTTATGDRPAALPGRCGRSAAARWWPACRRRQAVDGLSMVMSFRWDSLSVGFTFVGIQLKYSGRLT